MPTDQSLTELGNKSVSDLIGDDIKISKDGAVTGTLKKVEGWTEFDSKNSELQSGHYFPIKLDDKYAGKKITVKGKRQKTAQDLEWVLRVESTSSKFTFTAEGEEAPFLTLTFEGATLSE